MEDDVLESDEDGDALETGDGLKSDDELLELGGEPPGAEAEEVHVEVRWVLNEPNSGV